MLPPIFGRRNRDSMERVRAQPFVREDLEREKRGQFHRYWWRWDAGARGYRHIGSEEEIRFRGEATPPIGASGEWRRFDYICAEATYPLLVEFTTWTPPEPTEAELEGTKRNYPTFNPINLEIYRMSRPSRIWLVDHRRSAELWRREQGEVASAPPYGLWRRADEAFHGAALAWPPLVVEGPACDMVAARGGWLNGDWREDVYRLIRRRWSDTARKDERIHFFPFGSDGSVTPARALEFHEAADYAPVPLDETSLKWEFGERGVRVEVEKCRFESRILPAAYEPRTGAAYFKGQRWSHFGPKWRKDWHEGEDETPAPFESMIFDGAGVYSSIGLGVSEMRPHGHYAPSPLASIEDHSNYFAAVDEDAFIDRFGALARREVLYRPGAESFPVGNHVARGPRDFADWQKAPLLFGPLSNYRFARVLRHAMQDVLSIATGFDDAKASGGLTFTEAGTVVINGHIAGMPCGRHYLRTKIDPPELMCGWPPACKDFLHLASRLLAVMCPAC